jgi:hypothetical protein
MTDITGVRIVTFLESDVDRVSELVRRSFVVDESNSMDRTVALGMDRTGYRSVHFVCSLGTQRDTLSEYAGISNLSFEIQIRTVLQHAWATLAHDRSYKFAGVLPQELQRKLNLYAGMLEIADGAFDQIAKDIDGYAIRLKTETPEGLSAVELSSVGVAELIDRVIAGKNIALTRDPNRIDDEIIAELKRFGINNLGDIEYLATPEFFNAYNEYEGSNTYPGILRDLMMYADLHRYFQKAWDNSWGACESQTVEFLKPKYGKEAWELFRKAGIFIEDAEEEEEEEAEE